MPTEKVKQLQRDLARLQQNQAQTEKLIENFQGVIAFYQSLDDQDDFHQAPGALLKDRIELILQTHGQPLHPKAILQTLDRQGIGVAGEDPAHNIRSHMSGDTRNRFHPIGNGTWGLQAWPRAAETPTLLDAENDAAGNPGTPANRATENREPADREPFQTPTGNGHRAPDETPTPSATQQPPDPRQIR